MENKLLDYIPDAEKFEDVIKVIDTNDSKEKKIKIYADPVKQKAILYFDK